MKDSIFDGEYWNADAETPDITRFQFMQRADQAYVAAWGSCFPEDCEWGETELHVLNDCDATSTKHHAFATWGFDHDSSHCLFAMDHDELKVIWISIQTGIQSFKQTLTFRKDSARSANAQNPNLVTKFKHMWDGSEPGWKLVQYADQVFLVEFNFDKSGPSPHEIPAIKEFIDSIPVDADEMWRRLRDCSGISRAKPLGQTEMNRLRTLERENSLNLTVCAIDPDDYLVLTPDGSHYNWSGFPLYRRPVIKCMIDAGVPVVSGQLE